jgi:hypothetical protein
MSREIRKIVLKQLKIVEKKLKLVKQKLKIVKKNLEKLLSKNPQNTRSNVKTYQKEQLIRKYSISKIVQKNVYKLFQTRELIITI